MKIRPPIILFCAVVIITAAWVIWLGKRPVALPLPTANQKQIPTTNQSAAILSSTNISINTVHSADVIKEYRQGRISKAQVMIDVLSTENDVPINFYGKLEDQFGNPVVGAEITGSTIIYNGTRTGSESASVVSDANGFFKLDIGKGESLGIMPKRAGYILATTSTFFKYSHLESNPYIPDPNNPTTIKMWKLQGAEPLISFNFKAYILPTDGSPVEFNLETGQQVQNGGNLLIRLQSTNAPSVRNEYNWQVSIQMADGGIIQDSSGPGLQNMFQAPETGYESEFDLNFQKNMQSWMSRFNSGFYLKTQGDKYGKLWLEIDTDVIKDATAYIILKGYLNPSGSRNLEIDPAKVTAAKP